MATESGLLLDTQVLLWSGADSQRISPKAARLLTDPSVVRYVSLVSAWEMQIKHALGKLPLTENAERVFLRYANSLQATILPIGIDHIAALYELPDHHRDPFDRLLIAQAAAERLTLISADKALTRYEVDVFW